MPRIAEARPSAEPSSPGQKARYQRILRAAAAKHGAEHRLERVQMHDVAKEAGVAIAMMQSNNASCASSSRAGTAS